MFKAMSGALSLALTLAVLHWALPDVATVLTEVIIKTLTLFSALLDLASRQPL